MPARRSGFRRCSIFRPTMRRRHAVPLVGRARESRSHRSDAARPRSVRPEAEGFGGLKRRNGRRNFPRRSGLEDRSGAGIARAARSMPRSASSATSDRSTTRPSTRNFRTRAFGAKQWDAKGAVLNPVQKCVAGMGTDPAQADVLALRRCRSRLPGPAARARSRQDVGMYMILPALSSTEMPFSIALMIVVDHQPEMDERSRRVGRGSRHVWGSRKNCPNPHAAEAEEQRVRAGNLLPRPPAERRLGDRSLPAQRFGALALLDAQARGRASETILHGLARLRSAAGRLPRRRR